MAKNTNNKTNKRRNIVKKNSKGYEIPLGASIINNIPYCHKCGLPLGDTVDVKVVEKQMKDGTKDTYTVFIKKCSNFSEAKGGCTGISYYMKNSSLMDKQREVFDIQKTKEVKEEDGEVIEESKNEE